MDNNIAKGICILILFVLTLLFGWLPVWLNHRRAPFATTAAAAAGSALRRQRVLDLLNCFAGGVFLGTCLLHLLAEGREDFESYKEQVGLTSDFPFYETTVGAGLFLIAVVEKLGFAVMLFRRRRGQPDGKQNRTNEIEEGEEGGERSQLCNPPVTHHNGSYGAMDGGSDSAVMSPTALSFVEYGSGSGSGYGSASGPGPRRSHSEPVEAAIMPPLSGDQAVKLTASLKLSRARSETDTHSLTSSAKVTRSGQCQGQNEGEGVLHHHHHHSLMASTSCHPANVSQMSVIRALLLMLALSFHTIFDGLAVGLQDTAVGVWEVLTAIAIHKSLVAFCLGLELAAASPGRPRRTLLFLFVFALIAPVGIGIGMGVTSVGSGDPNHRPTSQLLASSLLQAVATGTFLYVTFFEILGQQFAHSHEGQGHGGHEGHQGHEGDGHAVQGHESHEGHGGHEGSGTCRELVKVALAVTGFACMAGVKLLDKD